MSYTPNLDLSKVAQGAEDWHVDWGTNCDILDAVIGKIKFTDGSGGSLTAGMVVYISAANTVQEANATDDTKPGVAICRTTDGETAKLRVIGIAKDVITIGASDIVVGDEVWLSTTAGKVTKTKPTGENNLQQLIGRAITTESSNKVNVFLMIETVEIIDWSEIMNKPSSSVSDIDDAVTKKHTQGTDEIIKDADGDTWHKTEKTSDIDELEGAVKGVTCYKFHDDGILDLPKQSRCRVYRATTHQTIPTETWTKLELNGKIYDNQNEFDPTTNYRFTAKKSGAYSVSVNIRWASSVDQSLHAFELRKNGVETYTFYFRSSGTGSFNQAIANGALLSAEDYLDVWVYQATGGDIDISFGPKNSFVLIHKLS